MRRIVGAGVTAAIAMMAVLPAGAAARATVVPSSVDGSASVPARGARSLTLTCPGTGVALHGAPVRLPSGVRVAASIPGENPRRWTFRFASVRRSARRVTAVLRCVRLRLPGGVFDVSIRESTGSRPNLPIPADSSVRTSLECPSGFIPTGQGVGGSTRAVSVTAAVPDGDGWTFRIENNGDSAASASPRIRCLQRVAAGRRGGARTRLAFRVKRLDYNAPILAGRSISFTGSCPRDRFSLGSGVSIDGDDDIALLTSFPSGAQKGSWFFRNSGVPERANTYLLCLSRSSRFR
jgi:hypothetical protein